MPTTPAKPEVKFWAENFDGIEICPVTVQKADQVWFSLINNSKVVNFEILQGADSLSQAYR